MSSFFSDKQKYFRLPGPVTSIVSLRARSSSTGRLLLGFLAFYVLATLYLKNFLSYRDPTSLFFDVNRGYDTGYSDVRAKQADDYIDSLSDPNVFVEHNSTPSMCVGVVSIARPNSVRYFRTAVGSLLEGLHPEERKRMHLVLFLAHTDPEMHPAQKEPWFRKVADRVLVYDLPQGQLDHLAELEQERSLFREKGLFDHNYLMKACLDAQAPYLALIEDDVLAADGWFHRTEAALKEVEEKTEEMGKDKHDFLYLRLFYTEEYLGWNSEEWQIYLMWSLIAFVVTNITLLVSRRCVPSTRTVLSTRNIIAICFIMLPLSILLFFAAGRATVLPRSTGVSIMNKYGCCFQGVVFPRAKAEELVRFYDEVQVGFKDTTTEDWADARGETRWALTPGVLQHIGRHSSKGDDMEETTHQGLAVSETLWSFPFEKYDADSLRAEHEQMAPGKKMGVDSHKIGGE